MIHIVSILVALLFILQLPTGFVPPEDQGNLMLQFTLPVGASSTRSENIDIR